LDDFLTIGLTTYNEEETISRVLDILLDESPGSSEILVVAGGEDRTVDIVKSYTERFPRIKPLWEEERKGKPAALNQILENASGRIVVLTDGDVFPQRGALRRLIDVFDEEAVGASCGRVVPTNDRGSMLGFWAHFLYDRADRQRRRDSLDGSLYHLTGYLCALRAGIIDSIPEDLLADDAVIGLLIKEKGYVLRYVPESVVRVTFPGSIGDFLRQKRRTLAGFLQIKDRFDQEDRSLFQEAREGFLGGLSYCKNIREVFYFMVLCFFRVVAWLLAYYDFKIRKKGLVEAWNFAETTKRRVP